MKPKKCKHCRNEFVPIKPLQSVCSQQCAFGLARANGIKKMEQETKAKRKELKEKAKTLSDYKRELQTEINKIVRLIDYGQDCISSGRAFKDNDQAGHFYSTGAQPAIRFNLWNIHSQSVADNMYKSGNFAGFRDGLIIRYGEDVAEWITCLPIEYKNLKLSKIDIIAATAKARILAKQIEKRKRSVSELIQLRKQLNKSIGIYD